MIGHVTVQAIVVLQTIAKGPICGADITRALEIKSGSLYPCLQRFESWGLVRSSLEKGTASGLGRPVRRFYEITDAGSAFLRGMLQRVMS